MKPLVCNYYLSYRCEASCEFCSIWQDKGKKDVPESSFESVKKNLVALKKTGCKVINFTGGEPLLRSDLPEILRLSKRHGFFTILSTSGQGFLEVAEAISPFADHLVFSLHSPDPKEHDRIMGIESFSNTIASINRAKEFKGFPVINFTVTRETILKLPEMVDLATDLGVLLWINPVYNYHGLHGFEKSSVDYIERYFGRRNVAMDLASLKLIKEGGNRTDRPVCRAGSAVITILPDNKIVSPCIHLQKVAVDITDLTADLKNGQIKNATTWHGKDKVCEGCMDWSYMNSSFLRVLDKKMFLALYSLWVLFWKEMKLKSRHR